MDEIRSATAAQRALKEAADPARVPALQRFFKTAPGEYAAGDRFRGLRVPQVRAIARHCRLDDSALRTLLASPWHEDRLLALVVMTLDYRRGDAVRRDALYALYMEQLPRINNWDLVDISAPLIVGSHLLTRPRTPLLQLADSHDLWRRRVAVLASFQFIRNGDPAFTLKLAQRLRDDPHDLIHKAVGWMLREVGKRDRHALSAFLERHARYMPRTMLRYAIERLPLAQRRAWLAR